MSIRQAALFCFINDKRLIYYVGFYDDTNSDNKAALDIPNSIVR